jgi:hypothetical protein
MTDEDGDGIPDTHDTSSYGDYLSWMTDSFTNDPDPWLMVDMGYTMTVSHMDIWNFNATGGNTDRGVGLADFYISVAEDPSSDFSNPAEWMLLLEDVALGEAPGTAGYDTPTMVDLLDTPARWIAIDILENLGDPSFVGLSEIMVYQHLQSTIPEPATLSLLGLGLLAVARRRRRR